MGGTISVESRVGEGSEFRIELPREPAPHPAVGHDMSAAAESPDHATGVLRRLLYVEDNPANLLLVEEIIAEIPQLWLLAARDGHLGIALARVHQPDVILMDINLPGISGLEALQVLRDDPMTRHIPIIALSANAMPSDIEKGLEAGFFEYLTKPISIIEFRAALNEALEFRDAGASR
ncbi:polar-differentiation response regulator DivK [mine drainage metagenome]|uniref:histidine kinase n=1 Tax=mine drainage metagenome TaxID=410659 RepID=A0A1J5QED1_9ZZZZ